jgi:hypothetical protein
MSVTRTLTLGDFASGGPSYRLPPASSGGLLPVPAIRPPGDDRGDAGLDRHQVAHAQRATRSLGDRGVVTAAHSRQDRSRQRPTAFVEGPAGPCIGGEFVLVLGHGGVLVS